MQYNKSNPNAPEMTYEEIGKEMGVSKTKIEYRTRVALNAFAKALKEKGFGMDDLL